MWDRLKEVTLTFLSAASSRWRENASKLIYYRRIHFFTGFNLTKFGVLHNLRYKHVFWWECSFVSHVNGCRRVSGLNLPPCFIAVFLVLCWTESYCNLLAFSHYVTGLLCCAAFLVFNQIMSLFKLRTWKPPQEPNQAKTWRLIDLTTRRYSRETVYCYEFVCLFSASQHTVCLYTFSSRLSTKNRNLNI